MFPVVYVLCFFEAVSLCPVLASNLLVAEAGLELVILMPLPLSARTTGVPHCAQSKFCALYFR